MGDGAVRLPLSRRDMIAASFAVGEAPAPAADPALAAAEAWLAAEAETHRLVRRWGVREAWLAAHLPWVALSDAERRALPQARELYEIDARLAVLAQARSALLARLARLPAATPRGLAGKAAVAAAAVCPDDLPVEHRLLAGLARDLRRLCG